MLSYRALYVFTYAAYNQGSVHKGMKAFVFHSSMYSHSTVFV